MKISQLSRISGVPIPTIKYYLREGLLPPGEPTAPNQAEYGDLHLHRLRLIRVLIDVGGLGIAAIRSVLEAIADETLSLHAMLGVAHHALGPGGDRAAVPDDVTHAREDVDDFLVQLGWRVSPEAPSRRRLADALVALRRLWGDVGPEVFEPYARAADELAARELASMPVDASRAELVERVVVGTVVFEAALGALRMLAEEHHSSRRFDEAAKRRRAAGARGRSRPSTRQ